MSACDVLFLVKNGCGLGHIRRAVLLSKELRRSGISSVIFSQASSLALYDDPDLRVVNLPLIERLKSSASEEAYASLLDALAARLDPRIVVEDTYPDSRYLSIPSLRGLPRVLTLRRLDPVSFEHIRSTGGFSYYDRVLVVQDRSDFDAEPHTPASRRLVHTSGRFTFCGPVFHDPDSAEISRVERDYDLDDRPLIVVTAGSGGDQLNDAYADRLFANAHRIAAACHQEGQVARFVLVQGPYYRGRRFPSAPNVRIVEFEPRLAALLRRATIVLMRPGHNVAHEALGGEAELVLVPGIPWMEGQREFAERLADVVGATVADVDDYSALETSVLQVLAGERRRRLTHQANGTANTAAAIAAELKSETVGPSAGARRQLVVIEPPRSLTDADAAATVADAVSANIPIVGRGPCTDPCLASRILVPLSQLLSSGANGDCQPSDSGLFVDLEMPARVAPHQLAGMGVLSVLYPDEGDIGWRMRRWLTSAGTSRPLLVDAPVARVVADGRRTRHLGWCLDATRGIGGPNQGLLLDCARLTEREFDQYLGALRDWLDHLQVEPLSLAEFTQQRVAASYLSLSQTEKT